MHLRQGLCSIAARAPPPRNAREHHGADLVAECYARVPCSNFNCYLFDSCLRNIHEGQIFRAIKVENSTLGFMRVCGVSI